MRWQGGRLSTNVEDRRGMRGPVMVGGGISTLVLLLIVMCLGGDPLALLQQIDQGQGPGVPAGPGDGPWPGGVADPAAEGEGGATDRQKQFIAVVLADTEDVWHNQFRQLGRQYDEPKLVLFSGQVRSACGFADAAVGPFYCPADAKVYLDTAFFRELESRFHAPGDFAQAYVIAHEIGHHVQNLLGYSDRVQAAQRRSSRGEANRLSVRLELQADFLAGVWAHHAQKARNILERGDIEEGMRAASAVGDDRLQRETRGYVVPDSFTHGTSAQRVRWFRRGLETGDFREAEALLELSESEL